jgi:excisionase family DNA binding protein
MNHPLLKSAEVAAWLSCSLATLSRMVKAGGIPCVKLNGGVRFDEETLKRWAASGGSQPGRHRGRPRMVGAVATQEKKVSNHLNLQEGDRFEQPVDGHGGAN